MRSRFTGVELEVDAGLAEVVLAEGAASTAGAASALTFLLFFLFW